MLKRNCEPSASGTHDTLNRGQQDAYNEAFDEIRQELEGALAEAKIAILVVRPVHRSKNSGIAALQRNVQVVAEFWLVGEGPEEQFCNLSWFN